MGLAIRIPVRKASLQLSRDAAPRAGSCGNDDLGLDQIPLVGQSDEEGWPRETRKGCDKR
jgi:hypothetical protein